MWKVTRKGLAAHKLRFLLTGVRGHPRRRVHVGHVRAHRDDPADVRRPVRRTSTRAPTRRCAGPKRVKDDFGGGAPRPPVDASVLDTVRAVDGVAAARPRCGRALRADRRRGRQGRSAAGAGPADVRVRVERRSRPEPVPPRARRPAARRRRRDRHRQGHAPTRATSQVGERVTVLTGQAAEGVHDRRDRQVRDGRQPRRRVGRAVHAARGAAHRGTRPASSARSASSRSRASRRSRCRHSVAATRDARPTTSRSSPAGELTKENQDDVDKALGFLNTRPARLRGSSRSSSACSSSTTRSRSSSRSGRGRWRCSARSARADAQVTASR